MDKYPFKYYDSFENLYSMSKYLDIDGKELIVDIDSYGNKEYCNFDDKLPSRWSSL